MSFKTRFPIAQQNVCRQAVPDVWMLCDDVIRPNLFLQCLMTDMRTLGIQPNGWKMARNDNLHNNIIDSMENKL